VWPWACRRSTRYVRAFIVRGLRTLSRRDPRPRPPLPIGGGLSRRCPSRASGVLRASRAAWSQAAGLPLNSRQPACFAQPAKYVSLGSPRRSLPLGGRSIENTTRGTSDGKAFRGAFHGVFDLSRVDVFRFLCPCRLAPPLPRLLFLRLELRIHGWELRPPSLLPLPPSRLAR
jgi:hypothetical protein